MVTRRMRDTGEAALGPPADAGEGALVLVPLGCDLAERHAVEPGAEDQGEDVAVDDPGPRCGDELLDGEASERASADGVGELFDGGGPLGLVALADVDDDVGGDAAGAVRRVGADPVPRRVR
jgi:hypothetical protein